MEETEPPHDPVAALSEVQDDRDALLEARDWAIDQILGGSSPETVAAALIEQGLNVEAAEEIAEEARKQTRSQRGIVTRDDIAGSAAVKYRRGLKRAAWVFRLSLLGVVILMAWFVWKFDSGRQKPAGTRRNQIRGSSFRPRGNSVIFENDHGFKRSTISS